VVRIVDGTAAEQIVEQRAVRYGQRLLLLVGTVAVVAATVARCTV